MQSDYPAPPFTPRQSWGAGAGQGHLGKERQASDLPNSQADGSGPQLLVLVKGGPETPPKGLGNCIFITLHYLLAALSPPNSHPFCGNMTAQD